MHQLFEKWAGEPCLSTTQISANGSNRSYYRLSSDSHQCIAAVNADVQENATFVYYAREMRRRGIRVPEIYAVSDDGTMYLQQDLGDTTLYGYLTSKRQDGEDVGEEMERLYHRVLDDLVQIQTRCRDIDFGHAYPRADFDRQSIQWDLNYFKYYFLKMAYIPFNEQLLENDFGRFADYLLDEDCRYFMYRDFQARNIMMAPDGELYYIDFQGGRRGPPNMMWPRCCTAPSRKCPTICASACWTTIRNGCGRWSTSMPTPSRASSMAMCWCA